MTGHTISHYRILDKLGEGGMGVVYKAEDTKLNRTVALKFLPLRAVQDLEFRARFVREAQAAAALHHPNICTVFELDEEHGFLAMELVEGPSLRDKIKERPLELNEALRIAGEVAEGLRAAHEKGILHRDIKSDLLQPPNDRIRHLADEGGVAARPAEARPALGSPGSSAASFRRSGGGVLSRCASPPRARGWSARRSGWRPPVTRSQYPLPQR